MSGDKKVEWTILICLFFCLGLLCLFFFYHTQKMEESKEQCEKIIIKISGATADEFKKQMFENFNSCSLINMSYEQESHLVTDLNCCKKYMETQNRR
jgi:hypothetical protein